MDIHSLIKAYRFNLRYAHVLVQDVDDEMMPHTPGPGLENHPAFALGHLVTAAGLTSKYLGGPYNLPNGWDELFRRKGPGDPRLPAADNSLYPSKIDLLQVLSEQHELVESLILQIDQSELVNPASWRFETYLPTLGDLLQFMCITHEAMHLSQLAAWRRAMGMDSALGKL